MKDLRIITTTTTIEQVKKEKYLRTKKCWNLLFSIDFLMQKRRSNKILIYLQINSSFFLFDFVAYLFVNQ